MKLTIRSENGEKIVDLKSNLQFNTLKGEQYVFSNGFTSYVISFKDNQESVVLTFNVNGKDIKIELNGIVPNLQANTPDMSNPTAIIINKDINDKDVDAIVDNTSFNGSEIIDRLEAIISTPVELGNEKASTLSLITDYQSLLESLGAAAAGAQPTTATNNGSTFNSIFSLGADSLNGIADTARWENLSESISTIPVDTGNTIATPAPADIATIVIGDAGSVTEANATYLTYDVKLSNAVGSNVEITLNTTGSATAGSDYKSQLQYSIDGTTWTNVPTTNKITLPADGSVVKVRAEVLDDAITESNETVILNATTTNAQITSSSDIGTGIITDEATPSTPDAQTALVSITGPSDVIEGDATTPYTVSISQAPTTDLTVSFTYSGVAANGTDFTGVANVVIKAGTTSATFTIATLDDNLAEGAEKFTVAINPSSLGKVGGLEDVRVSSVNNSVETTITDEITPPTPDAQTALVSITGPSDVIEGDATTPYTVSISQAPTTDLTVSFTYSGVAANGTDFTGVANVVIKAGTTSATFTIATLDDNLAEGAEKFTVAINPSSLGKVGGLEDVRVSSVNNSVETTITDEITPPTPDAQTALVSITGPSDVIEGDATTPYTVSISQAPTTDLTVSFTYSGVAANGTDFTGVANVVIKAGTTSATFTIATLDDNLAEGAEKFTVAINPSSLGKVGGLEDVRVSSVNNSVETTITDEITPPTPDAQTALVSITGPSDVIEGDATTPYTVSISQAPTTDLTVSFTYSGVAANGTDFTGVANVVIKAGTTSATFTIATLDDNLAEGAEKFTVAINPSSLGKVGGLEDVRVSSVNNSVETTITDEITPPTPDAQTALVSITGPSDVIEGDATTPYTVSISQAPTTDLTVSFTYSGVAANGTDFTGVANVVIKAGTTSATFTIATLDDNLAEGAEKFTVAINPSSLGKVGGLEDVRVSSVNNSVETTITDEITPPTPDAQTALVSITGPSDVIEGDATTPYTVSISQAPTTDLTVSFTYSGVAANGTDFTGVANVVIKAGTTSATFTIATLDDNLAEGAEKFTVAINPSSLGKVGGLEDVRVSSVNNSVETTITDEITPPTPDAQTALVSITGPSDVIEGDATTPYTVSISQAPTTDLTVSFTYSGVAANGTDFTGVANVVIKAGTTSATFTIATLDDNLAEGAEKFTVAINPSSLGKVGGLEDVRVSSVNNSVETTITDEITPPTPDAQTALVSITGPSDVIEGDATTPYTVSISQAPTTDLTVSFTYSGVAANGTDFTGVANVVIKAGTTSATFTIATLDDNLAEGAEKFTVAINPSSLGKVGGLEDVRVSSVNNSVETTITDEITPPTPDAQTALVSITGPSDVIEGDATTPYTVSISQAPTTDLTVSFTYSGVAANGTDFTGVANVVIKAGTTSATFTIATLDDNLAEGAEKFTVAINPSSLGKVGGLEDVRVSSVNNSVETTITDEITPPTPDAQTALVSITGPSDVIEGDATTPYTVSISQAPTTDLTVSFTYSGVAANGTDFTGVANVVIKAGTTSATFTIATLDDNLAEGAEKFTVAINPSSLGKVGGLEDVRVSSVNNSVETTITDEITPPTPDAQTALVSITGPSDVIEGDATTPYTVSISQAPTTDLTVSFTYSGVAANGTDFTGVANVVIKAGTTSATFTIATLDDNLAEGAEKFTVAINPSSLGKVGGLEDVRVSSVNNSVETTITDEITPPTPDAQTALVSITGPSDVIEGDATTPYTVSISQAPTTDLTVSFTYSGVAANGTDFTGVANVVIKAGTTSATFTIATLDDNLAEGAEKFTVAINPSSLGKVGGLEDVRVSSVNNSVETTITDEITPPTPDAQTALVSITGPSDVIEGDATTPYTVSISQAPTTDLTVSFTYSGVAANGTDFTGVANVVIKAGTTSATFTIATLDDNLAEGAEKFTVAINPSSLGKVGGLEDVRVSSVNNSVETTITDEITPPTPDAQTALVSITGPSDVIEGDATTPYTVSISQAPTTDLTVSFTYSGVAANGTDFTGVANVVIKAGTTSATFTIATLDDNLAEGAEKFTVAINPSSLGKVGGLEDVRVSSVNNSVETTITDEITPPTPDAQTALVSITGPSDVIEGDATTPYTVSISQAPTTDLTVSFTYSGVAANGTDFTGVANVVIKAGTTSATFTIATLDDNLAEGAEKFTVAINPSSLGKVGGLEDVRVSSVNNSVETTITDEITPPTPDAQTALVSITGPSDVIEGDATTPYTVSISQAPTTDLTVSFTYSGVAANGTDFTGVANVVIKAGTTSATFTIATLDDNLAEGAEKFTVAINPSSLGKVGGLEDVRVSSVNNSVETTITDEITPPTPDAQTALVSITGPSDVIEGDATTPYTVSISQAPTTDLTVSFTYSGVAANGTDFTGVANVVIKAGTTSATFTIATLDDNLAEGAEKFTVAINPSSLGKVGGLEDVRVSSVNNSVETTITDDDHSLIANNNTSTATETGKEFISSEDESNDGLKAIGNVIADDEGSNPLFITKIKFEGNMVIIPQDGSDITIQGDYGTLTINKSGSYTYVVNENTTDSWNTDRSEDDVFTYTLSDGYNPDDEATLTVTVEGKNDAPVINSVTGNNQGYKVVDGLLDVNGDGVVDTIDPNDLTKEDNGIKFLNESGDLNINMGTVPTSMTVEYNGGQAGYHNVIGYYTKDINGNIEAHIIYVENQSMVGSKSEMLGTLNNLTGEIGFFIIPNGGNNGITTNSPITFNSNGQMLINGNVQTVYYTDNNLNSDGLDHVVAGMAEDGSGLVIAFEDLQLGDRDYDDVVITINACKPLGTVTETTLLLEDFENVVRGSDETVGGTGWYVDKGTASDGILVSSNGNQWKMNDSGIEIRKNDGVDGLDTANGSDTYIELDAHTSGVNSSISTTVALGSNDSYDLSFNFTPRTGSLDSSDMQFSLDGQVVQINVDSSGNITFIAPSGVDVTISSVSGTSWYKVEATFNNITSSSAELNFKATGNADTLGAYIDNIKLVGNDYSTANTILTNIDLSDVDNANLASAKVELTNYKIGDSIEAPVNSYGITVSINAGVVTLTGTATKAQYEKVLESLTFTSTSEDRTPRTFEFTVNDGDKTSNTMKLTLDIGGCSLNPHTLPNSVDANDDYGQTVVQGEITIDSAVSGDQSSPDITYLDDGGYVIVWEEENGSSYNGAEYNNETERIEWATRINHDIFAQRFDKDGEPVGEAIQVNTFTTRDQHDANVTVLSNGRYLVTWTSDDDYLNVDNYDNASRYIKGRIYDENNNPVCNEFIVSRAEYDPIIGLPDGGFIVTWSADARYNNTDQGAIDNPIYQDVHDGSEYGIFGQRFDAYGNEVGGSFQINTYTSADQIDSDIALDSNGNILVTWQSENQDGSSYGIYTQKFEITSSGVTKIGSEVQVNTTTSGAQTDPEITALPNGKAIITWENGTDIYAQILGDNGSKIGNEIKVTSNVSVESNPVVTAISTGFIITWQSNESGNNDIFTQQFNLNGVKVGDAIKVNTTIIGEQVEPSITTLLDGGYIIAWQNGDTISAQRFNDDGSKYKTNSFDLDEDSSITITFAELMNNDTDPQGHTFKVTSVSNSQNGTAVLNDANNDGIYDSVKFTPNKDYNGSATFDYTITDEKGAVDKATVHLDVKPKGEPSIFVGTLCSADIKGHDVIVNEGEDVVFAVRVSGAENGSTVTLVLADGTGSNIATNSDYFESYYKYSIDFGTTWITVPSNGVLSNISNGNVIMVKTDTVNDAILESKEQFTLTATLNSPGSAVISDTAKGIILDNEADITVKTVTSETQTEGTSLVHTVTLSGVADSVKTYAYSFNNGSVEAEDIQAITFSNGVTYDSATGLISVPAGVSSFTITTPTVNDTVKEDTETYTISVGGVNATGTINDNEADITVKTVTSDTQTEGTSLVHTVTLSGVADSVKTYPYSFNNGSVEAEDIQAITFSNGVTYNPTTGLLSVPAGVTSFTITTPTIDDNIKESSETYTISVGGVSASGTINDNDFAPVVQDVNINVSEEGLQNGIKDTIGTSDITNEATITGTMTITDANNDAITVTLVAPTNELESNGQTVVWTTSTNGQELVGKVGTTEVIKVTINNVGEYKVQLLAPVTHPINSVEDVISLNIGVKASDGSSITTGNLVVNIEDDMPTIANSTTVWTQALSIPDILTGNVSFTGTGGTKSQYSFANNVVTVTGKGFTSSTDLTLVAANLTQTSNGIGIKSVAAPYFNLENEIDYRKTADGKGASEELKITLADGKISYGAKINFAAMFGGEKEVGVVEFYRGNVLVSTQTFSSDAAAGNYAANFKVLDGGFDTIIIKATDNGNSYSSGDNSDFAVSGVEFLGTTALNPIAYAQGNLQYLYGADGAGTISLTGLAQGVTLSNGSSVTLTTSNNSIIAKDTSGNLVFQIQLTPATGKWEFYQYQNIKIGDGTLEKIDFNFKVVDADGDGTLGSASIGINKLPVSTNDIIDAIEEDKSYIITKDDFGTYSSDILKIKVETLPTNGVLLLSGVAVLSGQEISKSDIDSAKLVFNPIKNSDADSSFTFKVSDGTLWSNNSYETKMNIIAVADAPIANINVKSTITIDNTNVKDTSNGYKVTAYGIGGKDKGIINEISSISNTDHDGFGVAGNTFHDTSKVYISGAWEEIGHDANGSEELVVTFDNLVSTVDISFAWKYQLGYGETALVKLYRDENYVDTFSFYGGSDGVDAPITITTTTGVAFDEIRFSAPNEGDDYLIHSISFTEVEANTNGTITGYIYNIDLSSALIDTDGSETLTVKISGVPTGATFNSANIVNNGNGIWEYTVPTDATSIDDTFKMTVPSSEDFALKVVSTSIESSNLSSATTDILSINDSDSIDLTTLINNNTAYKGVTDIIDITNTKANIMNIDMNDVIDLVDGDKQLVIKGDLEDKITLDTPSDWSNAGREQLDGVNYNVYTGTGVNSTIKLLIEDDIDVKPDI